MPMYFDFQIPVSCRVHVASLAIVSLVFISVVLLLSNMIDNPKYLNLFTFYFFAIYQHTLTTLF